MRLTMTLDEAKAALKGLVEDHMLCNVKITDFEMNPYSHERALQITFERDFGEPEVTPFVDYAETIVVDPPTPPQLSTTDAAQAAVESTLAAEDLPI